MAFSWDEAKRLREEAHREDRLYPLVSNYSYFTGHLSNGCQIIAFWGGNGDGELIFLEFSPEGAYLGFKNLGEVLIPRDSNGFMNDEGVFETLKANFNFSPGLIRILRFSEPEWEISIEPIDAHTEEFIEDPDEFFGDQDPESREALKEEELENLKEWVERKQFVFNCFNDYWVDDTGEVTDS